MTQQMTVFVSNTSLDLSVLTQDDKNNTTVDPRLSVAYTYVQAADTQEAKEKAAFNDKFVQDVTKAADNATIQNKGDPEKHSKDRAYLLQNAVITLARIKENALLTKYATLTAANNQLNKMLFNKLPNKRGLNL